MYPYQNACMEVRGAKCTRKFISEKKATLFTHPWMSVKTLKKKINSENTAPDRGVLISKCMCLYQNACMGYGGVGAKCTRKVFSEKRQHFSHIHGCL